MVEAGVKRAELALSRLDLTRPFNSWGTHFEQFGRKFRKDSMTIIDPHAPVLPQPEELDPRRPRQEIIWKGKYDIYLQNGWPFCRWTRKALKI
jgi:hypothetical protein